MVKGEGHNVYFKNTGISNEKVGAFRHKMFLFCKMHDQNPMSWNEV